MPSHTEIGEFIWRIADHLRGDYEKNDNEDVILPFTLLRRLDCVLEKCLYGLPRVVLDRLLDAVVGDGQDGLGISLFPGIDRRRLYFHDTYSF